MKKSKLTILFLICLVFSLTLSACIKSEVSVADQNTNQPVNQNVNININQNITEEASVSILSLLKKTYPAWLSDFEIKKSKLFWRRDNGARMALYNANALMQSVIELSQIPKDNLADKYKEMAKNGSFSQSKIDDLRHFFEQQNFIIDKMNTADELVYGNVYDDYLSFSKDKLKCSIYWNNEISYPTLDYIGCAQYNENDEKIYQEFFTLFSNPDSYWSVDKHEDNFAMGSYSLNRGGSNWIAKRIDEKWVKIWTGQEYPSCSDLKKYNIPTNFYQDKCFDQSGNGIWYSMN